MMSYTIEALKVLGRLFHYPGPETVSTAEELCRVLRGAHVEAAREADEFLVAVGQHDLGQLEELFTQTFEMNPACALDLGWHLFGEDYIRGLFLVRLREELRKYGVAESTELPDHICHVLAVVTAMPDTQAERFVRACVLPAVSKMSQSCAGSDSLYRHLVGCLEIVLVACWGRGEPASDSGQRPAAGTDLLRAFPVPDMECDCGSPARTGGSACDAVPLNYVPRDAAFPGAGGQFESAWGRRPPAEMPARDKPPE